MVNPPLKPEDTSNYNLSYTVPVQNGPLSCFLSSSVQPGIPSYSPSDWLLYSLGDWFTRTAPGPSPTHTSNYTETHMITHYTVTQGRWRAPISNFGVSEVNSDGIDNHLLLSLLICLASSPKAVVRGRFLRPQLFKTVFSAGMMDQWLRALF